MPRPNPAILLLLLSACTTAITPRVEERFDDPGAAAEWRALKNQGSDDPMRDLARAREQMRMMQRHSTEEFATDADSPYGIWKFLGPGNIGGRTRVLVIDPTDPRVMYTGGVSGGIWKTLNAGAEWKPIGDDLANIAINSLVMHPTDRNTLYAGTGEGYFRELQRGTGLPLRGDGIFVTHDAGETWTRLPSTDNEDFHYVNDLVVTTTDIHAATRTGVWRSTDSGATWSRVLPTTVMGGCLDLAAGGGALFASCGTFQQATIYRAKDGEWKSVFTQPFMGRTSLAIAPSDPNVIYALSASNEPGIKQQGLLGVFRSTDGGDTWTTRVSNTDGSFASMMLTNLITAYGDICSNSGNSWVTMGWYCNTIAVDPTDPNRVWTGGVDLFRSDDGGSSWGVASYWWASQGDHQAFVHADQHAIVFHPQYDGITNRTVYFTNDGGIYRTDDSRGAVATGEKAMCDPQNSKMVFTPLNNSYGVTQFYNGAVSPDGKTFIAGAQDNGTLIGTIGDGPNHWTMVLGGDGCYVAIDPNEPSTMYAEYQVGNIARSTNGGRSFTFIRSGLSGQEFLFVTPFVIDPNATHTLWIGGRRMWRTPNRGSNWLAGSAPLPALVSAIAVQPGDSNVVLAGTAAGHIVRTDKASTANAATQWQITKPRDGFVSWIAFDPTDAKIAYATYAGFGGTHVWMSNDGGVTWAPRESATLPDIPVHSLAVDPTRPNRLYLGTDLGVFVSLDRGQSWSVENTGFANAVVETVVIGKGVNGPAVYAFTHGRGAWRAELQFQSKPKRRAVR